MSNELINRQYVGARYVPKIMGEWNKSLQYEALSVVTYMGNSFTSKVPVPANIDITNEDYWINTGNHNAQVEEYRKETVNLSNEVTKANKNINDLTNRVNHIDNRKFIFISDSYGMIRDNTSWILKTVEYLGLSSDDYYEAYQGGFGFHPAFSGGDKISEIDSIKTLFFVTDSDAGYREMISRYPECDTYQLYRDYLDNFRINHGRN